MENSKDSTKASLSTRYRRFMKKYLDKLLAYARKDPDISYDEYNELKTIYNEVYKDDKH